jgi:acyl-CoA thioester hydrolase
MADALDRHAPPARSAFARFMTIATRWSDNDAYGHLNNVVYYSLFDSAVNAILVEEGLLDPAASPFIGLVVESHCRFYASLTYPEPAEVGVAIRTPRRPAATPMSMSTGKPAVRSRSPTGIAS